MEGSQGDNEPLKILPIADCYHGLPASKLDASVLDLARLYDAAARGSAKGYEPPTFADALRLHRLIEVICGAAATGQRQKR